MKIKLYHFFQIGTKLSNMVKNIPETDEQDQGIATKSNKVLCNPDLETMTTVQRLFHDISSLPLADQAHP